MRFLALVLLLLGLALPASAQEFFLIGPETEVDAVSGPFTLCPTLTFTPLGLNTAEVSFYAVPFETNNPITIEGGTLLGTVTTSSGTIQTNGVPQLYVYGVVDVPETIGSVSIEINCFNTIDTVTLLADKSTTTSTDNGVSRFDGTAGDVQSSGVLVDDFNNLTVPGSITAGGDEVPTCLILRDSDDAGDSACSILNGAWTCETDTNGVCDDAT